MKNLIIWLLKNLHGQKTLKQNKITNEKNITYLNEKGLVIYLVCKRFSVSPYIEKCEVKVYRNIISHLSNCLVAQSCPLNSYVHIHVDGPHLFNYLSTERHLNCFHFGMIYVKLLWTLMHRIYECSFSWGKYPRLQLLGCTVVA